MFDMNWHFLVGWASLIGEHLGGSRRHSPVSSHEGESHVVESEGFAYRVAVCNRLV